MTNGNQEEAGASAGGQRDKVLFWGCFAALVATAFGFVVRGQLLDEWQADFGLNETEKGEISGAGLWPFAITIVLFSLVVDKIGYGKSMVFAFICHVTYAIVVMSASAFAGDGAADDGSRTGYWMLYVGNLVFALGNGTVEAVINPVVATMFPREKTKWLSILHAGWPGGLVLGGILAISMGGVAWEWKVGLIFLPVAVYAVILMGRKFPVHERVLAGVSYRAMLQEAGILSALIVSFLIAREVGRVFEIALVWQLVAVAVVVVAFGAYAQSAGRPLFIVLLLIMMPLAITELGTDNWITDLMRVPMGELGLHPGWVLIYTSLIMLILRLYAGAIVHRLSPLGLLAVSSLVAACGLQFLSLSAGAWVILAATVYGFGKTFFWPGMLGVVSEQFPKGGALTLNTIAGVGMLTVGVIGQPFFGYVQETHNVDALEQRSPQVLEQVVAGETKSSVFGEYRSLDQDKIEELRESDGEAVEAVDEVLEEGKRHTLSVATIFPIIMLVAYLALILYFRSRGGYRAEVLTDHGAQDDQYTGGAEGPVEG